MQTVSLFGRDERGAVTVEFALTVIVFLFLVFFVAEMARMAYISSAIDLAISEAAKDAKNAPSSRPGDYQSRFNERLFKRGGMVWGFLNQSEVPEINITYSDTLEEMIASGGRAGSAEDKSLARYRIEYQYHPMFFPFPQSLANTLFDREVIFVQEYERSKFMD